MWVRPKHQAAKQDTYGKKFEFRSLGCRNPDKMNKHFVKLNQPFNRLTLVTVSIPIRVLFLIELIHTQYETKELSWVSVCQVFNPGTEATCV